MPELITTYKGRGLTASGEVLVDGTDVVLTVNGREHRFPFDAVEVKKVLGTWRIRNDGAARVWFANHVADPRAMERLVVRISEFRAKRLEERRAAGERARAYAATHAPVTPASPVTVTYVIPEAKAAPVRCTYCGVWGPGDQYRCGHCGAPRSHEG